GVSRSTARRGSTPRSRRASTRRRPARSSPTRPYSCTVAPAHAAHTAALAPDPPVRTSTSPWTSPPWTRAGPATATSSMTSPTTRRSGGPSPLTPAMEELSASSGASFTGGPSRDSVQLGAGLPAHEARQDVRGSQGARHDAHHRLGDGDLDPVGLGHLTE